MATARAQKVGNSTVRAASELRKEGLDNAAIQARLLDRGEPPEAVQGALDYVDLIDRQAALDARRAALGAARTHLALGAVILGSALAGTVLCYLFARSGTVVLMIGLFLAGIYELRRGLLLRRAFAPE